MFLHIYILELFWIHSKIAWKVQRFSVDPPDPHRCLASLITKISIGMAQFVTSDEPKLTCHYHPRPTSIVCVRVHMVFVVIAHLSFRTFLRGFSALGGSLENIYITI